MLGATLVGCDRISYPHTTWVLDDGGRDEVRRLAERFGARYLTRPTREHAKAGNINHALAHTSGQLLLILDADHVPQPDILDATVGYFDDPAVALVQTPHDFGNHDSFQHFETGRHDQSMFFEVIMPGKDRHDGAFWCGSAAVILRHALEGIGGIATETVAEDFHTTIRLHGQGWHTRYHDETLVQGLAPHDLASFLLQRDRWARGNLAVLRTPENPVIASGLSIKQRLSYLSSLLAYFSPAPTPGHAGRPGGHAGERRASPPRHRSGSSPSSGCPGWPAQPRCVVDAVPGRGQPVGRLLLLPPHHRDLPRASFGLLRPFRTSFKVTPKDGIDRGGWAAARQLRLVLVLVAVLVAAVVARLLAVGRARAPSRPARRWPSGSGLAFAVWELFLMVAALWRVSRRRQTRHHYRVPVEVAGVVEGTLVRVVDLTADGAGVLGPQPIPVGTEVELRLDLPAVDGEVRPFRANFTVWSCHPAGDAGWRMRGTLAPVTAADARGAHRALPRGHLRAGD